MLLNWLKPEDKKNSESKNMSLAYTKTSEIINNYHTNDPYHIAEHENIDVLEQDLSGRLTELYFGDYIILNKKLTSSQKKRYLAHALGHHFLHAGNYLFFHENRTFANDKEESQAEEFAAHLLIPDSQLIPILHLDIYELADIFQLDPEFIQFRLSLAK